MVYSIQYDEGSEAWWISADDDEQAFDTSQEAAAVLSKWLLEDEIKPA